MYGLPGLREFRTGPAGAGFADIWLQLSRGRADIKFRVRFTAQAKPHDSESLIRHWIQNFRAAGFRIGFPELGITNVDGPVISGAAWTASIEQVARQRAPAELQHDR